MSGGSRNVSYNRTVHIRAMVERVVWDMRWGLDFDGNKTWFLFGWRQCTRWDVFGGSMFFLR